MLLENFYKIIHIKEREDGKQAIEIELNPGHVLYQGHFPGQPVVPGVCTLQIIKESAEQIANQPLQYVQIASSKFLSAINPPFFYVLFPAANSFPNKFRIPTTLSLSDTGIRILVRPVSLSSSTIESTNL